MVVKQIPCKGIIRGTASGEILFSHTPISFIGGVDYVTGIIKDPKSDQCGQCVADKIFVFPFGKGSSGAGLVLLELIRIGKAPKAMVNINTSTVLLIAPLIAREFYKKIVPVVTVDESFMNILSTMKACTVDGVKESITEVYEKDRNVI